MIEVENLVKRFGTLITAVDRVSFRVGKGEVLGFLGPNGAGKSTTMKMITGFLAPSSGAIRVLGRDISVDPITVKENIGYLPEGAPAYPDMTPHEFLHFAAEVRCLPKQLRAGMIAVAVARTQLGGVLDQPIETLSKGFKRRVGLAQAILHDPPVLIMDEPTDGLDPNQKHAVRQLIQTMSQEKAIIISTHILEEVDALCTRALIIDHGRIVADGTPAALTARSRHHNAVHIAFDSGDAERLRTALSQMPGVASIETAPAAPGQVALIIIPEAGITLVDSIGARARAGGWPLHHIYAEAGRLDEVFRSLTTGDAP